MRVANKHNKMVLIQLSLCIISNVMRKIAKLLPKQFLATTLILAVLLSLMTSALGFNVVEAAESDGGGFGIERRGLLFPSPPPMTDYEKEIEKYREELRLVEEIKEKNKFTGMLIMIAEALKGFNAIVMVSIFDALKGIAGWVFWEVNIFGGSGEVTIVNYYRSLYIIALSALAAIIAWYAIKMITGNVEVPPIEMLVRISLIFGLMTFGLALIQDLLSINNAFVNFFLSGGAEDIEAVHQLTEAIEARAYEGGNVLFSLLLGVVMLVLVGAEIIALSIWAYYRMYIIYILAAIAPIAMVTLVFPSWSKVFSKWLQMLVRNIFMQAAWALSYMFGIRVLSNAVADDIMFISFLASLAGWFAVMLTAPKLLELFEMDIQGYRSGIKTAGNIAGRYLRRRLRSGK